MKLGYLFLRLFKPRIKIFLIAIPVLFLILFLIFKLSLLPLKESRFKEFIKSERKKCKIILIGLDGAEWSIINKLIEQNKLPNLVRLIKNGAYGNLGSIYPILSPPLWTSIITGKHREKHGITDFFCKYPGEYELCPVTSTQRKVKALWNIFSENGKSVGIVNWWASYPAERVKGCIVSDYPFSPLLNIIDEKRLLKSIGNFKITYPKVISKDIFILLHTPNDTARDTTEFILGRSLASLNSDSDKDKKLTKTVLTGTRLEMLLTSIGKLVIKKFSPDLFAIYFHLLDGAQHLFWHFMDYNAPWDFAITQEEIQKYGNVIYNCYRSYDKAIGQLLSRIDENATVIIVSDHGAKANIHAKEINSNLNFIFEKLGWLEYRDGNANEINWSKTRVYDFNPQSWDVTRNLYINLKGRDPKGIISKREFERFRIEIKENLEKIKTMNGRSLVRDIEIPKPTELITTVFQSPDLIVHLDGNLDYNQKIKILDKIYPVGEVILPALFTGAHKEYGIIIMAGKNIKRGLKIEGATILDIAPTILALTGLPIAKDMDGKVLTDAIEEKFLQDNPITYISTYEKTKPIKIKVSKDLLLDKYREELKERLRSLGYIQ